jgi:DNA-directed RNA polymerase specialized sigma subunit
MAHGDEDFVEFVQASSPGRVLVNHVTDRWRRRLREYATGTVPDRPAKADVAEEVTLRQWLIGALASLTGRERAVLIMRYYFDLPEATVAYELQISVGTVKSTSARALAKLRISADPLAGLLADRPARIPDAASADVQTSSMGPDQP